MMSKVIIKVTVNTTQIGRSAKQKKDAENIKGIMWVLNCTLDLKPCETTP